MNAKLRAAFGLLVLSSALLSCTVKQDADVYTIEFYTDYDGIEYEPGKLNKNLATKIGEGYVVKGGANKTARLTSLVKDENGKAIDYENSRRTREGYAYTWDSWVGFYEETALDEETTDEPSSTAENLANTKVDLKEIKGNCAVFAHFSEKINTYNVTIENADYTSIYTASVEYGTKLSDALMKEYGSIEAAKTALTLDYPLPKYYYQTYAFAGYEYDGGTYTLDELFETDIEIKDDLKLTAFFAGPESKSYTVSFYKDSTKSEILSETESVIYGNKVTKVLDSYTSDHKVYTFKGWEGTYGEEIDELKGKPVDCEHILYDCTLSPVFEVSPEEFKITFLSNDETLIAEKSVSYGSFLKDVLLTEIDDSPLSSDEIFTGLWSIEKNDVDKSDVVDPSSAADKDLSLYPVIVPKSLDGNGEKGDQFTYEYSREWGGYLMDKFVPSSSRSSSEFVESDLLDLNAFPGVGAFELVGIKKFGDGTESYFSSLTKVSLPRSVKYVSSNAFRGNRSLETLEIPGLQKADSFAFSQLYSLSGFTLPSSLLSIGSRAFYGCSKLGQAGYKITVEMSEERFESEVEHPSEWKNIGTGEANVEFQS